MDIVAGWVRAPYKTQGLDHLGSQAPCIALYSQLVPGVTNVTNRARYYTAYPWLIRALERNGLANDIGAFIEHFRRGDCLLTLVSERHAQKGSGAIRHGDGMVGRDTLVPALSSASDRPLDLSRYATTEEGDDNRYFKNRLGGLGQYYLGVLHDLGVLDGSEAPWVRYTRQAGQAFAEAMDANAPSSLFVDRVKEGKVTPRQLDHLEKFCFCQVRNPSKERSLLYELLFKRSENEEPGALQRRQTFCLLLSWVQQQGAIVSEHSLVDGFRRSIYAINSKGKGAGWEVPQPLVPIALGWKTYERNDLFSVAVQAIFFATLHLARWEGIVFPNVAALGRWLQDSSAVRRASKILGSARWKEAMRTVVRRAPNTHDVFSTVHEEGISAAIRDAFKTPMADDAGRILSLAAQMLILLEGREPSDEDPYAACPLPTGYLEDYEVNLRSFRRSSRELWPEMDVAEVLTSIAIDWGVENHFHIALRKLRHNSQNTFKIRPGERGLEIDDDIPGPVPTNPRLSQAFRILEDFNLIEFDSSHRANLTSSGAKLLADGTRH